MGFWDTMLGRRRDDQAALERETPAVIPTLSSAILEWTENLRGVGYFSPQMLDRLWVATRCIQLNAQQIAAMPIQFVSTSTTAREPAWLSSPDPVWYPNGIGDALHSAVKSYYGWGDIFLYVIGRYETGFPSAWTVLDPATMTVETENGRRTYRLGERRLQRENVVQISRDPSPGALRGTSAIRSYASQAWSMIAAGEAEQNVMGAGTIPNAVLKSQRKLTADQAAGIQDAWVAARQRYGRGVPAILPPELDLEPLSIDPKDILLMEVQEFDARVLATAFGVPASLLNMAVTGGLTYQNPATLGEQWWRFELRPTAKRIADALSAQMLPRGSYVTFDASDTFAPIDPSSEEDDPQASQTPAGQNASPADENVRPLRPAQEARP